jgi:hypothetical protein
MVYRQVSRGSGGNFFNPFQCFDLVENRIYSRLITALGLLGLTPRCIVFQKIMKYHFNLVDLTLNCEPRKSLCL